MKKIIVLVLLVLVSKMYGQDRYSEKEVILPSGDSITYLKYDYAHGYPSENRYIISPLSGSTGKKEPVNGVVYCEFGDIGNYINGKKDGMHRRWHKNGKLKYETYFKDGKRDSLSIAWYYNGLLKSIGNYKDGKKIGVWQDWGFFDKNFSYIIEDANYKDDLPDGLFSYLNAEANYKDGLPDGLCKVWWWNGQLSGEGNCKDGKGVGLHKSWYENGQLESEANYKDGKTDGLSKSWHRNGQLSSEFLYKNGKLDGLSKSWWNNDQLFSEMDFIEGKCISVRRWDKEGNEIDCRTGIKYKKSRRKKAKK